MERKSFDHQIFLITLTNLHLMSLQVKKIKLENVSDSSVNIYSQEVGLSMHENNVHTQSILETNQENQAFIQQAPDCGTTAFTSSLYVSPDDILPLKSSSSKEDRIKEEAKVDHCYSTPEKQHLSQKKQRRLQKEKTKRPKKPKKCIEETSIHWPADYKKMVKRKLLTGKKTKRSIECSSSSEEYDVDMVLKDSTDCENK